MSMSNTSENNLLKLIFNNTTWANVGDATGLVGSTVAGSFYISLHTADPGEGADQTTSEATYTGYARVAVARSSGGFTVSANSVSNAAIITFGLCTAGSSTVTHFGIGRASSGTGELLYKGALSALPKPFTAKTTDTITIPGLTLIVDDRVAFEADPNGTLPTGMTEGTLYFVKTVSGDDITIATTSGGTTIDLTTSGGGVAVKVSSLAVSLNITPSFAIGALAVNQY